MKETCWVLTGPTASGKTALSLRLARTHDCEIVCMDSMQIYRGMDIGTAKPTADERAQHHVRFPVPHEYPHGQRGCVRSVRQSSVRGRLV